MTDPTILALWLLLSGYIQDHDFVLEAMQELLPPFHPWKYLWIEWIYPPQATTTWPLTND